MSILITLRLGQVVQECVGLHHVGESLRFMSNSMTRCPTPTAVSAVELVVY